MDAEGNRPFTIEELAVRWIMTPAVVASRIATGAIPLTAVERRFPRSEVFAFERTPYGQALVLRAIRIEADEVTRSHQQAAGYESHAPAAEVVVQTIDGTPAAEAAR